MASMSSPEPTCWTLEGDRVSLRCGPLVVDPQPITGGPRFGPLGGLRLGGEPLPGVALFSVAADSGEFGAVTDRYVRGDELAVTYAASESFPFLTRLRLHAAPTVGIPGALLSLTVAVQTDLLDTQAKVGVGFLTGRDCGQFPYRAALAWRSDPDTGAALLVAPHPDDWEGMRGKDDGPRLRLQMRCGFLEKGVIRCWRAAAAVVQGEPTDEQARAMLDAFAAAPLPLTA